MFELSVALKYLIPRWRQLSVSIISLVSTLVIALVVWLIVVFFSVKDGLENSWIEKIVALTAPVRVTPTDNYYSSYYYLVDTISSQSDYSTKTIGEKLASTAADPYDPAADEEVPAEWAAPDRNRNGELKDLVKEVFAAAGAIKGIDGVKAADFETTAATINLDLIRDPLNNEGSEKETLEHGSFIGSFDADSAAMRKALLAPSPADYINLLAMQSAKEEKKGDPYASFFDTIAIDSLKITAQGWRLPVNLLPASETILNGFAVYKNDTVNRILLPIDTDDAAALGEKLKSHRWNAKPIAIKVQNGTLEIVEQEGVKPIGPWVPLHVVGPLTLKSQLVESSLAKAKNFRGIRFQVEGSLQGIPLSGSVPLGTLEIDKTHWNGQEAPIAAYPSPNGNGIVMPAANSNGEPLLVPKGFRESGVLLGDRGYLSYYSPTPSTIQEQRIAVYVAGFYDPGIIPIGGKYLLAGKSLTALIRASYGKEDAQFSNGINIHFDKLSDAARVKAALLNAINAAGVAPYWKVESYHEYPFTKDIIQQLQSEKNLFSLISLVIIIVACSNIISMLIILVNDKKLEIGILRSMGATSASIAAIFGFCGVVMGAIGSLVGVGAALVTLRYVNELVALLSRLQGHDLFNPLFYGNTLPTELSVEALFFVMITTAGISLLAGIVPAVKASMMRPSAILRSE